MIKIAVISPYEGLARYATTISENVADIGEILNIKIDTFIGPIDEGVNLAKDAEAKGYDSIIARGITYKAIQEQVKIPVLNAQESLHDLVRALYAIKGCSYKVNLFLFEDNPIFPDNNFLLLLNNLFNIDLTITRYKNSLELKTLITGTKDIYDVFVGGIYVVQLSESLGKKAVLLETGYDTLFLKAKECIGLVNARDTALFQRNQLKTILDYAYEGMIYVDKHYNVRMMNPTAKKILGIPQDEETLDKPLGNIALYNQTVEAVQSGTGLYQEFMTVADNVEIMINIVPVIIKNEVEGVVINFKAVEQVLQMAKKIRAEIWKKGNFAKYTVNDIIGISNEITASKELVKKFGKYDSNVLIYGETGTGKELFAQSIHNESKRRLEPFYAINCATLPENLLESELFGYSEGAFTGAKKGGKPGLFELAHNGTLYLDEIGDMPLSFQSKLLRALQEKEIRRIGDDKTTSVNVRIIAASHKNLYLEFQKGNFREDLYYRINVMYLKILPLRKRKDDIPYLIDYFMTLYKEILNGEKRYSLDIKALEFLANYAWPGNVRQLQNFVERVYIYGNEKEVLTVQDVQELFGEMQDADLILKNDERMISSGALNRITAQAISDALDKFGGNRTQAAKYLGVSRSYLWRHLNSKTTDL